MTSIAITYSRKFRNSLRGGDLGLLTSTITCTKFQRITSTFDDATPDIVHLHFVLNGNRFQIFNHKQTNHHLRPEASQFFLNGIGLSFSTPTVRSDARTVAFLPLKSVATTPTMVAHSLDELVQKCKTFIFNSKMLINLAVHIILCNFTAEKNSIGRTLTNLTYPQLRGRECSHFRSTDSRNNINLIYLTLCSAIQSQLAVLRSCRPYRANTLHKSKSTTS